MVRGLKLGIETDRVPERRLRFPVALEVVESHAEARVHQIRHGQRRQPDRRAVALDGVLPAPALGERHPEMEVPVGESRIELERLLELGEGLRDLSEIQEQEPQAVAIARLCGIDGDRLAERDERRHRLLVVEVGEPALVGGLRTDLLHLDIRCRAPELHHACDDQMEPIPASSRHLRPSACSLHDVPTYEYECGKCRRVFEIRQRISEPPLQTCEDCGGEVRRLLSAAPFILKGGGWYVTDYPSEARKKALDSEKPATSGEKASAEKASAEKASAEKKTDSTSTATTTAPSTTASATGSAPPSSSDSTKSD